MGASERLEYGARENKWDGTTLGVGALGGLCQPLACGACNTRHAATLGNMGLEMWLVGPLNRMHFLREKEKSKMTKGIS